jgi:hypothetical protein
MFYSQDSFIAYSDAVLESIPDDFAGGDYGLSVGELRNLPGLGAACLVNLANVLGITDDISVIKFLVTKEFEVQYCVPPAFRKGKTEAGTDALFFTMGDFKIEVPQLFAKLKDFSATNGYGKLALKKITIAPGTQQEKLIAGFKFDLTKPSTDDDIAETVEYEFAIAPNRKEEDAQNQLVRFLDSGKKVPEIIKDIIASSYVGKIFAGGLTTALKLLPVGMYEISEIDRLDKIINKKDGTQGFIKGWTFDAVNCTTGQEFVVETNDGSFVDKKISGTGFTSKLRKSDPNLMNIIREALAAEADGKTDDEVMKILSDTPLILKQAAVGRGGSVMMLISEQKVIAQGVSPQGEIMTNVAKAKKIFGNRLPAILEAAAQKQQTALPATTNTINVEPVKSAEPVAA